MKVKYVVILWDGAKFVNRFEFQAHDKSDAIALYKNLVLRYGERNVDALSIDSDDDAITYDMTKRWLE